MEKMDKGHISNRRAILGIFLIAVGSLWIFERLDLIPSAWNDVLISWQMLLIGIGIFSFIGGNKTTGTVLMVIGGVFLLPEVAHVPYEIRRIGWPIILVVAGVVMLISQTGKHRKDPTFVEPGKQKGMDFFDDFVIFGGREVYVDSQRFYGGRSSSVFGGAEYDLRQAHLSENGAVIDCLTVFGGCGFKVPPDWTVKNEVTAIFGAFTDKRGTSLNHIVSDPSKTLVIKGFAAFGGVEVKYM